MTIPDKPRDRTHAKDIAVQRERCFLIRLLTPDEAVPGEDPLAEIAELLATAGGEEVGRLVQKRDRPHPRTYLHKGKLAELAEAVKTVRAETVVVDDDLSPTQLGAVENACSLKVIDRNELILDIFQAHARTHQAKLQVQLAQLQYELPRLARKWTHLERLGGGIGVRGPGESQIETDRRLLRAKITQLRGELDALEARKVREVGQRGPVFAACLVGYTNAGKSTLLNRVTGADAYVENKLFATLDTLTRRVGPDKSAGGGGAEFLLSDTVGFIRRLPHHLVASFHATLEEAAQADLLAHVIDASDPFAGEYVRAVDETLASLGLDKLPRAHVLNKIDAAETTGDAGADAAARERVEALARTLPGPVFRLSARTGEGVEAFVGYLRKAAEGRSKAYTLRFSAGDGRRLALLNEHGRVEGTGYEGGDCVVRVVLDGVMLARIRALPGAMTVEE